MDFNPISKARLYGLHGEFTVGSASNQLRAQYVETKIRPGSDGAWDNALASLLVPWREIFDVDKVTFDELLQRDLNDSRVAHDLIPYLVGETGAFARFFPPILVVLVPKNTSGSGIEKVYPHSTEDGATKAFGTLFDFKVIKDGSNETPFAEIAYNPQRTAFIIVDGQHRAMAVLALHRQLTNQWTGSKGANYESYYRHIEVNPEHVRRLELPVCIVFFPDLTEAAAVTSHGHSLDRACRELFLTVNRKAQPVSEARNLLLDDDDFAALMMRRTLSTFKGRTEATDSLARIYSFRYGDSDEEGKAVQVGRLEYSSAVILHKLHCIGAFGNQKGFSLREPIDISSGQHHRNSDRPAYILVGTPLEKWTRLTRNSASAHTLADVREAVELLGALNDIPILRLFDDYRPFAVFNRVLRQLKTRLSDPTYRADPVQNKAFVLLFEGSGTKAVFEDHLDRLEQLREEFVEEGRPVSDYIKNQLHDGLAVSRALVRHERDLKRQRACQFFNIAYERFYPEPESDSSADQRFVEGRARAIFDTVSTQAFQIGYLATIMTLAQQFVAGGVQYDERRRIVEKTTDLVLETLNAYFAPGGTVHETASGLVRDERSGVFSTTDPGLRSLLGLSVAELNERQWPFFRYAILEMMFSKHARKALQQWLAILEDSERQRWVSRLSEIAVDTRFVRHQYIQRAVERALKTEEFLRHLDMKSAELKGAGQSDEAIRAVIEEMKTIRQREVEKDAKEFIRASVGALNAIEKLESLTAS